MKIHFIIINVVLFLGFYGKVHSQEWLTSGNNITTTEWFGVDALSTIPIDFIRRASNTNSQFRWFTTVGTTPLERMRLTQLGFLGLNTTAPATLFHMDNGALLATGTTGANPNLGAGTRMMWIPAPAAYRSGSKYVSGSSPLDGFSLEVNKAKIPLFPPMALAWGGGLEIRIADPSQILSKSQPQECCLN